MTEKIPLHSSGIGNQGYEKKRGSYSRLGKWPFGLIICHAAAGRQLLPIRIALATKQPKFMSNTPARGNSDLGGWAHPIVYTALNTHKGRLHQSWISGQALEHLPAYIILPDRKFLTHLIIQAAVTFSIVHRFYTRSVGVDNVQAWVFCSVTLFELSPLLAESRVKEANFLPVQELGR